MDLGSDICVLAPSVLYTVTVESKADGSPEVHFHAGGQGFWVARMAMTLGGRITLCAPIGGESGLVVRTLIETSGILLKAVSSESWNGGYVHDRRSGERAEIVEIEEPVLRRHEIDSLVDSTLALAGDNRVLVLTAPRNPATIPASVYPKLAKNAAKLGCRVAADLSGECLAALTGIDVLKVAHNEAIDAGFARGDSLPELLDGAHELRARGHRTVIVSRGGEPALAVWDDGAFLVHVPELDAADTRGAGDSMTGAIAVGLAGGLETPELVRLAAAAGAMNVTRHGLGSGNRDFVEVLVKRVTLERI